MNALERYVVRNRRLLAIIFLAALWIATGCTKVTKPTSDSTPPTVRWHIITNGTNATQDINGSGTITSQQGQSYKVMFFAEDPQGIHQITLASSAGWQCISGSVAQNVGPGLGATTTQDLQPDSQGNVLTSIFLIQNANMGPFDCQSGFTFNGGSVVFYGTGTNYFNGTTKGTLTFQVP